MSDELSLWWKKPGLFAICLAAVGFLSSCTKIFLFFLSIISLAAGFLVLMKKPHGKNALLSTARMCRRKFSHWCQGGNDVKNIHENKRGIRKIAPLSGWPFYLKFRAQEKLPFM